MLPDLLPLLHARFPTLEPALLTEMARVGTLLEVDAAQPVLRAGQLIRYHVLLLDGLLKVFREDGEGAEFLIYYLEPGSGCAMSMLPVASTLAAASQVAARAVQPSRVLLIPTYDAEQWLMQFRSWSQFVIDTYRRRFEELLQTLDGVAFRGLDERLIFYLRRHTQAQGPSLTLSHQQIADELSSSREVISRLLKKLEQRGVVELHRSHIEIKKLPAL